MAKRFSYECQTLGSWTATNPQQAMLNLLEVMVSALWFMEDEGSLQKMLCAVPQPSYPHWEENAAKCADPAFRRAGLEAGDRVLTKIHKLPPTHGPFRKMARLGAVSVEAAAKFERYLWERLVNHCFQRDGYTRNPKDFLIDTADMLKACTALPDGEEPWACPHCEQLGEVFDQLVDTRKSIRQ